MEGTVKWFDSKKNYGFILGDDEVDYFVHGSNVEDSILKEKDKVEFIVKKGQRGLQAIEVRKVI